MKVFCLKCGTETEKAINELAFICPECKFKMPELKILDLVEEKGGKNSSSI